MMYAAVKFSDYRKEQSFEVIASTDDLEHAKKVAFQNAKKELSRGKNTENYIHKITSNIEECTYLNPENEVIVFYRVIGLDKINKGFKLAYYSSNVYAVVEMKPIDEGEEIDSSLMCDEYYPYHFEESDEERVKIQKT